ncbi:MAG TPA: hypothetical protein VM938_00830 [Acidimicrobiales bacterium]|nr:hypothetical protein [Acidimicrobiales bacterium]
MSSTSEYASDGTTLVEVIRQFEADGYDGQFAAAAEGKVHCFGCDMDHSADEVALDHLRRTEGASDPDDMVAVAALTCAHCGNKGTLALKYGPEAPMEEADVLARLDDQRQAG